MRYLKLIPLLLLLLVMSAHAQDDETQFPLLPMAYVDEVTREVVIDGFGEPPFTIEGIEGATWIPMAWSESGDQLLFKTDAPRDTMLYDRTDDTIVTLVDGAVPWIPVAFDGDDPLIIAPDFDAPVPRFDDLYDGRQILAPILYEVFRLRPNGRLPVTGFVFGVECQGGSPNWAYGVYQGETGRGFRPQAFFLTDYGLIHTVGCSGSGTVLTDLDTRESTLLSVNLTGAKLSPDGEQILGIEDSVLTVVTLATGEITTIPTETRVTQANWGAPGTDSIFYTSAEAVGRLDVTPDDAVLIDEITFYFGPYDRYRNTLYRLDMTTGTSEPIYSADVYGIGKIIPTPDGRYVLFSQVPNMDVWVKAVVAEADPEARREAVRHALSADLYLLDLENNVVTFIGEGRRNVALNIPAYLALNG